MNLPKNMDCYYLFLFVTEFKISDMDDWMDSDEEDSEDEDEAEDDEVKEKKAKKKKRK